MLTDLSHSTLITKMSTWKASKLSKLCWRKEDDAWLCENEDEEQEEEEEAVALAKEKFSSQNGVNQTTERQLNNLRKTD